MEEYTTLEQVKIRLKQFHIETVENEDNTESDVVVLSSFSNNFILKRLKMRITLNLMLLCLTAKKTTCFLNSS